MGLLLHAIHCATRTLLSMRRGGEGGPPAPLPLYHFLFSVDLPTPALAAAGVGHPRGRASGTVLVPLGWWLPLASPQPAGPPSLAWRRITHRFRGGMRGHG